MQCRQESPYILYMDKVRKSKRIQAEIMAECSHSRTALKHERKSESL